MLPFSKRALLTALMPLMVGCHSGLMQKRHSELNCPTDIRKTVPWCAGEDAIFRCPCGPSSEFYGHKPTCWGVWPAPAAQWRDSYCGPLAQEGIYGCPVAVGEEISPEMSEVPELNQPDISVPAESDEKVPLFAPPTDGLPIQEPSAIDSTKSGSTSQSNRTREKPSRQHAPQVQSQTAPMELPKTVRNSKGAAPRDKEIAIGSRSQPQKAVIKDAGVTLATFNSEARELGFYQDILIKTDSPRFQR